MSNLSRFVWALALVVFTLVSASVILDCSRSSGEVTHCYTQKLFSGYYLYGRRDWRYDLTLAGPFQTLDEVVDAAKKYGCVLK